MNQRRFLFVIQLMILVLVVAGTVTQPSDVVAQTGGFLTALDALEAVLSEHIALDGQASVWHLGEVEQTSGYALSIALANRLDSSNFVLLLARQESDGTWYGFSPEVSPLQLYNAVLMEMPASLLNIYEKSYFYQYESDNNPSFSPRNGNPHYFPWPIRETARLTQKDSSSHVNQLDFVLRDSNDVYSSKPGTVVFVKEVSGTGGCNISLWTYANMVVVRHGVGEYSWYVHLAQNSVTVEVGDQIGYGTKIGDQGNTGFACGTTGVHLHYMASTAVPSSWPDPTVPNNAPWPPSGSIVAVDFAESTWSALTVGQIYESQNAPPPGICAPVSQAIFYDNTYCNGQIFQQSAEGLTPLELISLDDRIESIALPTGWSLALYKDANEIGPSICLNQSDQMLWNNQFSDSSVVANKTTWFRLYTQPNCPYPDVDGIKFFPDANFGGLPVWGMVGARATNGPSDLVGSIYVPNGFSAKIYDQDDSGGNSLCLSSSVLNLNDMGWNNRVVESVELISGNSCVNDPGYIPPPILVQPLNNAVVYGPTSPELCWQMQSGTQGYNFNALVYDDTGSWESGWISESCWSADSISGIYGDYSWSVQAKNANGDLSQWSLINSFSYVADTIKPVVTVLSPLQNSVVKWPKANLIVNPVDQETSIARVYFLAWYDDGSNEYIWHSLGMDEDGSDGWQYVWNLTVVQSTDAAVAAFAEDQAGNTSDVTMISGITIVRTIVDNNGYQTRDSRAETSDRDNPPFVLPAGIILPNPQGLVYDSQESPVPDSPETENLMSEQPGKTEAYWKSSADLVAKQLVEGLRWE